MKRLGKLKTQIIKHGPMKGWTKIKMPKVSWEEMEQYGEKLWNEALRFSLDTILMTPSKLLVCRKIRKEITK